MLTASYFDRPHLGGRGGEWRPACEDNEGAPEKFR